jgi:hypothetical protein
MNIEKKFGGHGVPTLRSLVAVLALAFMLNGCVTAPLAFKWADDDGALAKAALSRENIRFSRNCEIWKLSSGSPSIQDDLLTINGAGSFESACHFTSDKRLIVVSPRKGKPIYEIKLAANLSWFAYVAFGEYLRGFWLDDSFGSPRGYFVHFMNNGQDGQRSANETVEEYLRIQIQSPPKFPPPVRVKFIASSGFLTTQVTLP